MITTRIHALSRHSTAAATGICLLVLLPTPELRAQTDCQDDTSCTEFAPEIQRDLLQKRFNRTLTFGPDVGQTTNLLKRRGATPEAKEAVPVIIAPDDSSIALRMSSLQWSAYLSRLDQEKIEALKPLAPEGLKLPTVAASTGNKVEFWSNTRMDGLGNDDSYQGYTCRFGTDTTIGSNLLFGVMVELEDGQQQLESWNGTSTSGSSYLIGPYMMTKLGDNLKFQAQAAYGESYDSISDDGIYSGFASEYGMLKARLEGNWQYQDWQFTPGVSMLHAREMQVSAPGSYLEKSQLIAGPEINKTWRIEDGPVIKPFVNYSTSLDLDAIDELNQNDGLNLGGTMGTGVTVSKPDEYTIRATTEIEEFGNSSKDTKLRSRVQVNVPLN